MTELQNVTVYKCEHCNYTDTMLGRMKAHENTCLSEQLKKNKNIDKQEIYNLLDIDVINIKIKEFLKKYNLPITSEINVIKLTLDNSFLPGFELDKSVRSIFDKSKFRLHNELSNLRYSKEYMNYDYLDSLSEIDNEIVENRKELEKLLRIKYMIIEELIQRYLSKKEIRNEK